MSIRISEKAIVPDMIDFRLTSDYPKCNTCCLSTEALILLIYPSIRYGFLCLMNIDILNDLKMLS